MPNHQNAIQTAIVIVSMLGTSFGAIGLPKHAHANTALQTIATGSVEKQTLAEQKEAAIAEIITAIATDTAQSPPSQSPAADLLNQLSEYANSQPQGTPSASHTATVPNAATLGGPVSLNADATFFANPTVTNSVAPRANLAALSNTFSVNSANVPALKDALNSNNELTRLYAADTLWTLTGEADLILPTLIAATDSDSAETRELALSAIAQLGQAALPAVPALNDIIHSAGDHTDNRTRQLTQDVLNVISSENRPATVLGILAREVQRLGGIPALFRTLSRLW